MLPELLLKLSAWPRLYGGPLARSPAMTACSVFHERAIVFPPSVRLATVAGVSAFVPHHMQRLRPGPKSRPFASPVT